MATAEIRGDIPNHEPTPGGWVEDLGPDGLQARCLTGFNAGPPITPGSYNNNMHVKGGAKLDHRGGGKLDH